jgi:hypothetical protein
MLPSQLLKLGNSIDVRCAILAMEFENYQYKKQTGDTSSTQTFKVDELQAMINTVRGSNDT